MSSRIGNGACRIRPRLPEGAALARPAPSKDDPRPGRERGREDTEVTREVGPCGVYTNAVVPSRQGALEPQLEASIIQPRETIGGDRRAGEVAGHNRPAAKN